MKDLSLLVWLTQLGLSTALPLAGFVLLAAYLQECFSLGSWVIWVGLILGLICAIRGFRDSLKAMDRMSQSPKKPDSSVSYNDHD